MIELNFQQKDNIGFQYIIDELAPCSPYGEERIKGMKPFTRDQKSELLRQLQNIQRVVEHREACASAMDKLMHTFMCIKNVRKIAEKCVDGTLNAIELFEIKRFLLESERMLPLFNEVNAVVCFDGITLEEVRDLAIMEPFGMGNPQPAFLIRRMRIEEITPISHDRHAKFYLNKDGVSFQGIIFGMGAKSCRFVRGDLVDVVFAPEVNTYRGTSSVQMVIRDMRWHEEEQQRDDASQACYDAFCRGEELGRERAVELSPARSDLVAVFRHVRTNAQDGLLTIPLRTLYRRVRYESGGNMNLGRLLVCLDVFAEFDLFDYTITDDDVSIRIPRFEGKADINGSVILKKLTRAREGL